MNYFISENLFVKNTSRGLGVFSIKDIAANSVIEHSPFSSCWSSKWEDTPENLRKIVFSYPQNADNYVIPANYILQFSTSLDIDITVGGGAIIQKYYQGKININ